MFRSLLDELKSQYSHLVEENSFAIEHKDEDLHLIGESIASPSEPSINPGSSFFSAREDHSHFLIGTGTYAVEGAGGLITITYSQLPVTPTVAFVSSSNGNVWKGQYAVSSITDTTLSIIVYDSAGVFVVASTNVSLLWMVL